MNRFLRSRWRDYRLKHEKDQPLDEAIYMTIATGRLEPLLRALATYPVYSSGQTIVENDSEFLLVYSTQLRAAEPKKAIGALLTEHLKDLSQKGFNHLGARLNPGGKHEITLEAHNISRLNELVAGIPTEDALTAIASESLEVTPCSPSHQKLLESINSALPLPKGLGFLALSANFYGFKPGTWPVLFLVDSLAMPQEIPSDLREELQKNFPQVIAVNPALADWRRDLFWDYRHLLARD